MGERYTMNLKVHACLRYIATHIAIIPTGVYKCIISIPSLVPSWILPMENRVW